MKPQSLLFATVAVFVLFVPMLASQTATASACYIPVKLDAAWTDKSTTAPFTFAVADTVVADCAARGAVLQRVRELHVTEAIACSPEDAGLQAAKTVARLVELNSGRREGTIAFRADPRDQLCSSGEQRVIVRTYQELICGLVCPSGTSPDTPGSTCRACVPDSKTDTQ